MQRMIKVTAAAVLMTGGALVAAAPAWAGADDGGVKQFWSDQAGATYSAPAQTQASPSANSGYRASYNYQPAPTYTYQRSTTPADQQNKPEEKDIYFYHSMGTMSRP